MSKPTVELLPSDYQPTKPELEEQVHIQATPEAVAKAVTRPVTIRRRDPEKHKQTRPFVRRRS